MLGTFGFRNQLRLPRWRAQKHFCQSYTPGRQISAPGLAVAGGNGAGTGIMNDQTIKIGERHAWGEDQPFGIAAVDERQHLYIIGKTGSGKTTLLRNLILQHIMLGHGVGLIDPHGDLAEDLLNHIPTNRAKDVVYFNPGDIEFPVGLNVIGNIPQDDRHLVASGIVTAFKGIWRDSWGPRLEYILYNAVSALLDCRDETLLGVNRLLMDRAYRARVVEQIKDPFIKAFWTEEYEGYDERFRQEAIAPIQNKIGQFLLNPVVRNILGQVRSKVNIPHMMNNGGIFIANLSKGRIGHEKANLLGSLLVSQFQLGAMARATKPESERRDFFLFIDEFQNFSTDAFASILAEARKYRLCLTLSHQYIDQLPEPIRQAVFGNVGTLIAFRIGYPDAEVMAREFGCSISPTSLADLERYEAVVKLLVEGSNRDPFRAKMMPPLENQAGQKDKIVTKSRERYAMNRNVIEQKLKHWMAILS